MIRLLIVDDHPIVRSGLVTALDDQPEIEIVGSVGSGSEALLLVSRLLPNVILLDLEMSSMSGISALPKLLQIAPEARILVFTAYDTEELVQGALRAGAAGYLLKGASVEEIVRAIQAVHAGGAYLAARVATRLLHQRNISPLHTACAALSVREIQVLQRVSEGLPNKQIAVLLHISERTVKFHLTSIFAKLNADNRAHAVALAVQQGLLEMSAFGNER